MHSMTGFGDVACKEKSVSLDISVKTVNGRYLDIKIVGPRIYQCFENDIKELVRNQLSRGTVEVSINRRSLGAAEEVTFNALIAEKFLKGYQVVAKKLRMDAKLTPELLLQVPDFFKVEESPAAVKSERPLVLSAVKKALSNCLNERRREGKKLQLELARYIKQLQQLVAEVQKSRASSLVEMKKKFEQRLRNLPVPGEISDNRIAQEIVLLVERGDVGEEVERLRTHLAAVKKLLLSTGSIGKKLDFFAQELLREVNTIGSKSCSTALTKIVVDAKDLVEKFREQVQNIE